MKVLILYNAGQTYTETVFEHLDSFRRFSKYEVYYRHLGHGDSSSSYLVSFDVVVIHYSIRLPQDHITDRLANDLKEYSGLKVLFIQDEYDHTNRAKYWIERIGFQIVFTVVPERSIEAIYPRSEFPRTRFINCLTGYVPQNSYQAKITRPTTTERNILIGYRGRSLPLRYGALGFQKSEIGRRVRRYCELQGLSHDIQWSEEARIYGERWYDFISSCRGMLGSESGCNIFDFDGTLDKKISQSKRSKKYSREKDIYDTLLSPLEIPNLMNQVSPRIFEMISARTAMVLMEGGYSGVITADKHYISVKPDYSNLKQVFDLLQDDDFVTHITDNAYNDIIATNKFSYQSLADKLDIAIDEFLHLKNSAKSNMCVESDCKSKTTQRKSVGRTGSGIITDAPYRSTPPPLLGRTDKLSLLLAKIALNLWQYLPMSLRSYIKDAIGRKQV